MQNKNRIQRLIFGPKGVRSGRRKVLTMKDFVFAVHLIIKSRRLRWAGHICSQNGQVRSVFEILTGKPIGKRSLGRSTRRCG